MYAIRSYYDRVLFCSFFIAQGGDAPPGQAFGQVPERLVGSNSLIAVIGTAAVNQHYGRKRPFRITSYNVCYTKLLRLRTLDGWLDENRELIREKFSDASRYTPGLFDYYVVNRLVDGIIALLHEIVV